MLCCPNGSLHKDIIQSLSPVQFLQDGLPYLTEKIKEDHSTNSAMNE